MAQYKKKLKLKMLNTLILVEDFKNIKDLINKVIKINNYIYQREQANKRNIKQIPVQKILQQALRQQYRGLELMDFNRTKESQDAQSSRKL